MIELQFDDSQVKQLLNAVVRNMTNPQPALHKIGEVVKAGIKDNFEEGGAYSSPDNLIGGSKKWKPLSPVTKKIKARQGKKGPYQILVDSARLRNSINSKTDKESVEIGTNVEYAAMQHFGAKKGEFGIHDVLVKAHIRNIQNYFVFNSKYSSSGRTVKGSRGKSLGGSAIKGRGGKTAVAVKAHQRRMPIPFGNIPARPFMTIHPTTLEDMVEILSKFILDEK